MTSPSDPNLEPSAEKVRLYLDLHDQQIVIGALLQFLNSLRVQQANRRRQLC